MSKLSFALGPISMSHTAYAQPGLVGSAVTDSLVMEDPRTGTLYNFFNQIFNTGSNAGGAHGDRRPHPGDLVSRRKDSSL
jgi:hypothetical protein